MAVRTNPWLRSARGVQSAPTTGPDRERAPVGAQVRAFEAGDAAYRAALAVEQARPRALRAYDQIPMFAGALARQAAFVAPSLMDRDVVFVGDHDGTSMALGLLGAWGEAPAPARMVVLDFDERLLRAFASFAERHGFADDVEFRLYNVFDPLPPDLVGRADAFYTNPPYGSRNRGASVRLFLGRALEAVRPRDLDGDPDGPAGYALLPYDEARPWTQSAMLATQGYMNGAGWTVGEMAKGVHGYALDDDPDLLSALVRFEGVDFTDDRRQALPFAGRRASFAEVPLFYGARVLPPWPRYVLVDGTEQPWS